MIQQAGAGCWSTWRVEILNVFYARALQGMINTDTASAQSYLIH